MALGYGGHPEWRDMSEYVVHLTGPTPPHLIYTSPLFKILTSKALVPGQPFGAAWNIGPLASSQKVVSFSEIPLDHLTRLADRHGTEGLGFRKEHIATAGGAPVWYVQRGTRVQNLLFNEVKKRAFPGPPDDTDWLWQITPFIDYPGAYSYADGAPKAYDFRWEREWRLAGTLQLLAEDVLFLVAREEHHRLWAEAWVEAFGAPSPPLLDTAWSVQRIQMAAVEFDL